MIRLGVSLAVDETDLEPVAAALAGLSDLHLDVPGVREQGAWHDLAERLSDQNRRLQALTKKLNLHPAGQIREEPETDIRQTAETADALLGKIENRLTELTAERKEIADRMHRLRTLSENRSRLEAAGIALEKLPNLSCLHLEFGTIPADQQHRITTPVVRTPVVILPLFESEGALFVAAASLRKNAFVLKRMLTALFYEPIEGLSATAGAPRAPDPIETLEDRRRENERNRARLAEEWADRLSGLHDRIATALAAARIIDRYGRPGEMVVFTGTIAENRLEELLRAVDHAAQRPHTILTGKFREAG